jgi:acyl carrier protein
MVAFALAPVRNQVLRIISQRKHIQRHRLRLTSQLEQDLHFDTVDVVDIILALEQQFHLTIPDEVPLRVVGDFVHYVATHRAPFPALAASNHAAPSAGTFSLYSCPHHPFRSWLRVSFSARLISRP